MQNISFTLQSLIFVTYLVNAIKVKVLLYVIAILIKIHEHFFIVIVKLHYDYNTTDTQFHSLLFGLSKYLF